MMSKNDRDYIIDYMRFGALLLILLAHVGVPAFINEIRCFDVVMMVFLAGFCYQITSNKKRTYLSYLFSRVKKLLLPTWFLLIVIFLIMFLTRQFHDDIPLIKMVESFCLYDGIGYVWFVRVTLMLAVISPVLRRISSFIGSNYFKFWFSILLMTAIYIVVLKLYYSNLLSYWPNLFFYLFVVYTIGYSLVYYIGLFYFKMNKIMKILLLVISIIVFCVEVYLIGFKVSENKYPPGAIYLSYGLICTIIVYEILKLIKFNVRKPYPFITWLSINSFTIYLIHIIPVVFLKYYENPFTSLIKSHFLIEYVFVLCVSLLLTFFVIKAKNCILNLVRNKT